MRAVIALSVLLTLTAGAFAVTDPYAWLEDTHGEKPLAWVADHNKASLGPLKADPRFAEIALIRQSRLSVMAVSDEHWALICALGGWNEPKAGTKWG